MPGATVPLGIPYPLPTDPVNVPADVQALAEKVDALYTSIAATESAILQPPTCLVTAPLQTTTSGTLAPVSFNNVVYDNAGFSDLISHPTYLVAPAAGRYLFHGTAAWAPNGNDQRIVQVNTTTQGEVFRTQTTNAAGNGITLTVSSVWTLAAGEQIFLQSQQTSPFSIDLLLAMFFITRVS